MKVIFSAYEAAPFYKVGGLGDVAGSLPLVLSELGVEIRVLIPFYEKVEENLVKLKKKPQKALSFSARFAGEVQPVEIWQTTFPESQVPVYLLKNKKYLAREKKGQERTKQWLFFSQAGAEFVTKNPWPADLLHLNDWHTCLFPLFLPEHKPTVLTIHNLAYQGITKSVLLKEILANSPLAGRALLDKAQGQKVNLLREGIMLADIITTVSPTYAKEILTPRYGEKLDKILQNRRDRVFGILNGLNYHFWDPRTDQNLSSRYSLDNWVEGKRENRIALEKEIGLTSTWGMPLIGIVTRLVEQKGIPLLLKQEKGESTLEKILKKGFQMVILGQGNEAYVRKLTILESENKGKFCFFNRFDDRLARLIYAGADYFLMPSLFEPCGLVQLIAMRYGTLPIVHQTGGLADTVLDGQNGFVFEKYNCDGLLEVLDRAWKISSEKKQEMIKTAMKADFSWRNSAKEYLHLYQRALKLPLSASSMLK